MARPLTHAVSWLSCERWLIGASLARIGFGGLVSLFLIVSAPVRSFVLFDNGMMTNADFAKIVKPLWGPNLFALTDSQLGQQLIFAAALFVCIAYTAGFLTRITAILFAIVTWSIFHRSPAIIDGGYRLLCILTIYLSVANVDQYWSVDNYFRRHFRWPAKPNIYLAMLGNSAIILCLLQLCIVYLFSAFYKVQGEAWQQGTALYYAVEGPEYNTAPLASMLLHSPTLLSLGTYATLVFQAAFCWLIWHERLRIAVVVTAIGFHIGIALTMGLYWFSAVMMICEVLVLTDTDYLRIEHLARSVATKLHLRKSIATSEG